MIAGQPDFSRLMHLPNAHDKSDWLHRIISESSNTFVRELADVYLSGVLGDPQKMQERFCRLSKKACGKYQFSELVKCAVSHPASVDLLLQLTADFSRSELACHQEEVLAFHALVTLKAFQTFDSESYSRLRTILGERHGQTKSFHDSTNAYISRFMLSTTKKKVADWIDIEKPYRYQDVYFYYSSSHVMGFYLSQHGQDPTPQGLTGSTASISNTKLLEQIAKDHTIANRRGDQETLLCIDRFTTGNMYHTSIVHLLGALIHDGLYESKAVNCFSSLTWIWTRKLIAQIFPRNKVDYGLVPDKRCFIKNAILYNASPLSLLNEPLHREKFFLAVRRLRNAAIALAQNAQIIDHPKRIFISRHKRANRSPINLVDLERLIKGHNFEIFYFEDIAPEEQLSYVHHAEMIAGLHGAALTNILAARATATILEFSITYENRKCYENLGKKYLGLNYLRSCCISKVMLNTKEVHHIDTEIASESLLKAIGDLHG